MFMPNDVIASDHWASFGTWLEEQRIKSGKSKTQAAADASMDRSQWGRIEKGTSGTRRSTIPRIALAVGADEKEAYEAAGFRVAHPSEREVRLGHRLDIILRRVSDEKRRIKIEEMLERDAANYVSLLSA